MARKPGSKNRSIDIRQTEDGLHLTGSILWFDSKDSGDLSFLSSATSQAQPRGPQVIATEETVKILEAYRKRPQALICQYNRPFSIGQLKMELLPSGCVLGGASLYVETEKGRVLYAPQLQPHRIPTVRQMQLKNAHTLILGVTHPDPTAAMPGRKKERERFVDTVLAYVAKGEYPIIVCEPMGTAQELTQLLAEHSIPLAVHDSIFRVNNTYEFFGSHLGPYTRYSKNRTKNKVTIFPMANKKTVMLRSALPERPVFYVEDTRQETVPPSAFRHVKERFFISSTADGPETKEIISLVRPKQLYIFGPYAKSYVEAFEGLGPTIKPLFVNDQPTLF